ncbi:MAG: ethylbenzene dehydrogenase-related protein [Desulfotalea sp.]
MKLLRGTAVTGLACAITSTLLLSSFSFAKGEAYTLDSMKISAPISLEASNPAWDKAPALNITLAETPYKPKEFPGQTKTNVTLKSLYDNDSLYMYMQYDDSTQSLARYPWIKQEDGSWKQLKNKDYTGHENTYYEDKVGMFWNISTRGFAKKGCAISCHMTTDGKNNGTPDTSAGRKYTRSSKETIDMWHWKSVRTGMAFDLSHDQYVDNNTDPKSNKGWGRHGDEKLGGGYKNNMTADKKMPMYMSPKSGDTRTWLLESEKVPFVDTFKAGDMVPAIVVSKMTGSAADIQTSKKYENGKWTLVFKRALTTDHPKSAIQDVQFDDLSKAYYFGVAVFDNTQINHIYHDGSIKLQFK